MFLVFSNEGVLNMKKVTQVLIFVLTTDISFFSVYHKSPIKSLGSLFDFWGSRGGLLEIVLSEEGSEKKFFSLIHIKYEIRNIMIEYIY